jgi:hypothetical protein
MMIENRSSESFIVLVKMKIQLDENESDHDQANIIFTILSIYIPPIIIALGSCGNIVAFLVLRKICKIDVMYSETSLLKSAKSVVSNTLKSMTAFKRNSTASKNTTTFDALLLENNEATAQKSSRNSIIKLKHTTSNGTTTIYLYLCALAIFDLGVLYFGLFNDWLHDLAQVNLKSYSNFFCRSVTFLAFVTSHSSSFLIVMTSFIRFVAFYSPFKTATLINTNNFKSILMAIVGVFVALNGHFLWTMHLIEAEDQSSSLMKIYKNHSSSEISAMLGNLSAEKPTYECRIKSSQFSQTIWPVIDKLVYSLLPFILILVFNLLIIINMSKTQKYKYIVYMSKLKSGTGVNNEAIEHESINRAAKSRLMSVASCSVRKKLRTFSATGMRLGENYRMEINYSDSDHADSAKLNPDLANAQLEIAKKIQSLKKKKFFGKRFTFMLIGLSLSFLVLTLPVVVTILLAEPLKQNIDNIEDISESNRKYELLGMAQRVAFLLMYLNHSINFLVYYATSARFRRQFESMFLSDSCLVRILLRKLIKIFRCRTNSCDNQPFFVFRKDNSLYA